MATVPLVSVEEYLHSSYRPDCDYVDGAVLERNLGQHDHARLQGLVLLQLMRHESQWGIHVLPEQRLKIRPHKYRVPDVLVLASDAPRTPVIEQPPLLCIEIVSPDDRMKDLTERAGDYLALGVPQTWILDPSSKRAYVFSEVGLHEARGGGELVLGKISLDIAELFAQLG
jgi:Uma2 family endonuclease